MSKSQPWDYFPLLPLYAFASEDEARKFVKKKTGKELTVIGKNGQCTWYDHATDPFCVIVLTVSNIPAAQRYALIAHECVHYQQYNAEHFGNKLDPETEAFVVQSAMLACIDQIGEEWLTETQPTSKSSAR